jgi:neuromedin U receptor 2
MSVDRACAVLFPLKAKTLCTTSRAKKIIITIGIIPALINTHMFFTFDIYLPDQLEFATVVLDFKEVPWVESIIVTYNLLLGFLVPFLIILVSNNVILVVVKRASSGRNQLNKKANENTKEDQHLTRMLIFISVAYIILCSPYSIYEIVFSTPEVTAAYDISDIYWLLRRELIHWSMSLLTSTNSAINFYLYILGGGKKFRSDALKVLGMANCVK